MNNMSQYNNTPDEAERLLDELLLPVNTHEAQIGRAYTIGHLLPLIRAGLAMQRLDGLESMEIFMPDGLTYKCCMWFEEFTTEGKGTTVTAAINAALDAAGVEK